MEVLLLAPDHRATSRAGLTAHPHEGTPSDLQRSRKDPKFPLRNGAGGLRSYGPRPFAADGLVGFSRRSGGVGRLCNSCSAVRRPGPEGADGGCGEQQQTAEQVDGADAGGVGQQAARLSRSSWNFGDGP